MKKSELIEPISTNQITFSQVILAFAGQLSRHWPLSFKSKVYRLQVVKALFRRLSAEKELLTYREKDIILQCYRRHWVSFCMGSYEPVTQGVMDSLFKPGMAFVDAGANIGLYSIRASRAIGEKGWILAIEPHPAVHSVLKENIAVNRCKNVHTWEVALGETAGTARLYSAAEPGSHSLLGGGSAEADQGHAVKILSLDKIVGDHPVDLVKLDLEGSELLALKGMKEILRRKQKPILLVEFCSDWFAKSQTSPNGTLELLESYGYRIRAIDDQAKRGPFDLDDRMKRSLAVSEFNYNLLCVPTA